MDGFISGGVSMGYYQSAVYGLKFARSEINAYESIDCNVS
jgi:hypothetical protein